MKPRIRLIRGYVQFIALTYNSRKIGAAERSFGSLYTSLTMLLAGHKQFVEGRLIVAGEPIRREDAKKRKGRKGFSLRKFEREKEREYVILNAHNVILNVVKDLF